MTLSLTEALHQACAVVGIEPNAASPPAIGCARIPRARTAGTTPPS